MSLIADAKASTGLKQESQPHHAVRPYRLPAKIMHWTVAILVLFMVASGISMKQLGSSELTDFVFTLHKTAGAFILLLVVGRFCYRVLFPDRSWKAERYRRPYIHWLLYGLLLAVPLLGWAGVSDFGARDLFFGLSLPAILPQGTGWSDFLFESHAYAAFGMLVVVALHIGMAVQDHMTRSRWDAPEED
ncbi:MAG: cytochrome b/b6 domain-containing protein [Xanthobacteraceae bacterium]|nr:cytochrome b/b6 domain-containing protein [Xanthobacteraceae bacterium]MCW5676113.1 cytochrome b/b6 domain-containing protein [Xanthobacteraceae bacterium]